jgi:hypothetical protein
MALVSSLAALRIYPRFKKIEKRGPAPTSVAAIVPGDVNTVAALIGTTFNDWLDFDRPKRTGTYKNKFPYGSQWSHFFLFRRENKQHSMFPTNEEILIDRGADSFVERYVHLPPELRIRDFYLYEPSGDYYWNSEYFYNGQSARFRCSFLIHVEASEDASTKVEIFEYQPTIWVGEYLGLSAHALLPAMLHDIRSVGATTTDRKELLAIIQKAQSPNNAHAEVGATASSAAQRRDRE